MERIVKRFLESALMDMRLLKSFSDWISLGSVDLLMQTIGSELIRSGISS